VDWIKLAKDRVQWRDFVNTVMKFQFLQKSGEFLYQMNDCKVVKTDYPIPLPLQLVMVL
jgi:hypothetical protein